ncbi:casein kinase II subunit alpha, chloroplastic-like [Gossypium australe]|uniref:Casein kinase II subunit alpha, chloroplastic-like n=1 Tax=Gossypium australe TaxID=47621 RepID=A0A5B6W8Y8_9ROSI|nr:casein kinase II subunit alpha, chloroplastic-like [Gossypium australe]
MEDLLQLQIFYNGLDRSLGASLDGASVGAFINNTYERTCKLIKDMAMNSYMWPNDHFSYSQKLSMAKVVKEDEKYQHILEKLHCLETTIKPSVNDVAQSYMSYLETQSEEVNFLNNRGGNPYSNTYNLSSKDHLNLKLRGAR